ncbi:transcriptional regulator, DeoR family [Alkaliphilus metalliredigens QYMF]|uniref:Transcriptional regulator, DeoR family n=1 Tax=Alkaliphilus metalliredigens (strain QYMF) TaxID=293826 RepID=A6TT50_ALKMQ|nr:sugar-binding transcriptional regulator [Alkaliphilus metalliredigens]ABR49368.1 transcriptional regulator, DeoR family [Alkaliphilus metalliredigens QYMF]
MDQYEKLNETEKKAFLAKLAHMYYELNMTQVEIAASLSTTRFKVSKLLQEARTQNVVEIIINRPNERLQEIEALLTEQFNLKAAIVLDTHVIPYDETIPTLGKLGATYLESIITDHSVIGVLWGKTIFNVIKHIKPQKKIPITAVQVLGAAAMDNPSVDSPELIQSLATIYGGKYKQLYAPLYIDNDYARKALLQEPVINDTLFLASKADVVLTGVGTVDAVFSSTLWTNYLTKNKHHDLISHKAVGCIYARLYDINGMSIDVDINEKVIGLDLNTFRQAKYTIGVASGTYKAEAILGALRGGFINVLITDDTTALKVLSLNDSDL